MSDEKKNPGEPWNDFDELFKKNERDMITKPEAQQFLSTEELMDLWKKEDEEWDFVRSDEDIIARYGQETLDLVKKIVAQKEAREALWKKRERTFWGRLQNKRTEKKERQAAVNWIMHGPGGD